MINDLFAPKPLGFRVPAEWEFHSDTWIVWPEYECTKYFKNVSLSTIESFMTLLAMKISESERVNIIVSLKRKNSLISRLKQNKMEDKVLLHGVETDSIGIRSWGAQFLTRKTLKGYDNDRIETKYVYDFPSLAFTKWQYRGNTENRAWKNDDKAFNILSRKSGPNLYKFEPGVVFDPGNTETNGLGIVVSTYRPFEKRNISRELAEQCIKNYMYADTVIWCDLYQENDNQGNNSNIDNVARFIDPNTLLVARVRGHEEFINKIKSEYSGLNLSVYSVPVPAVLGAGSYLNFYITNQNILVPDYGFKEDIKLMESLFRRCKIHDYRDIFFIPFKEMSTGVSGVHDLTCQQPHIFED